MADSGTVAALRLGTNRSDPGSTRPSGLTVYRSSTLEWWRVLSTGAIDSPHEINRGPASLADRTLAVRVAQPVAHARSASVAGLISVGIAASQMYAATV